MINDVYKLHALEKYTARLEQETIINNKLIASLDSAIRIKDFIIQNHSKEATSWKGRYENQRDLTIQERRGKRRWRVAAIVATGLFVWVAVSQ